MSDISTTSCKSNSCDNGMNPMLLILLLLLLCGGDNGLFGCFGNNSCGCFHN